jgi:anti-anti-sigma factor
VTASPPARRRHRPFAVVVRPDLDAGPTGGAAELSAELSGELDISGIDQLWDTVTALHRDGHAHVVLDLAGLDFLDAAGLGALVRADRLFRADGARLVLSGVRPVHRRLLQLTGLDRTLTLEPPADERPR